MINQSLFSSNSDEWTTPKNFMAYLNHKFGDMFDPCPIGHTFDGLAIEWQQRNFVNPPYSKIGEWVEKAYNEFLKGKFVCLLIPARTDTKYFHMYLTRCQTIYFVEGRLKFGDSKNSAPFPSMICVFDPTLHNKPWPELRIISKEA